MHLLSTDDINIKLGRPMGEAEDSFGLRKFLSFRVGYFEGVHQVGKEKEEFLLGQLLPYACPPTCRQNRNNSVCNSSNRGVLNASVHGVSAKGR